MIDFCSAGQALHAAARKKGLYAYVSILAGCGTDIRINVYEWHEDAPEGERYPSLYGYEFNDIPEGEDWGAAMNDAYATIDAYQPEEQKEDEK